MWPLVLADIRLVVPLPASSIVWALLTVVAVIAAARFVLGIWDKIKP
jgi:hypothetical protein